jgi:hypothetical protein
MLHAECIKFFEEVISAYWPDYEPDKGGKIVELWKELLLPIDYHTAVLAAKELKLQETTTYSKRPIVGKFREVLNKLINEGRGTITHGNELPEPTVFVMCTTSGAVMAGTYFPVYAKPLNQDHSREYLLECAHQWINGFPEVPNKPYRPGLAKYYGGEWSVYQDWTVKQMDEEREKYQKQNPKPKFKPAAEALGNALQAKKGLK